MTHEDEAAEMGKKAREKVRRQFLITRQLSDYLHILNFAIQQGMEKS